MTEPTIPPEAVTAAKQAFLDTPVTRYSAGEESDLKNGLAITSYPHRHDPALVARNVLTAAYPHLRRAILVEVVPKVVEMARYGVFWQEDENGRVIDRAYYHESPASILAAMEQEG